MPEGFLFLVNPNLSKIYFVLNRIYTTQRIFRDFLVAVYQKTIIFFLSILYKLFLVNRVILLLDLAVRVEYNSLGAVCLSGQGSWGISHF